MCIRDSFLSARFLLRDWVQSKFGERLKAIDDGIARDGAMYLFTIRLIPLFPFFVVNLLMGLTRIKTRTYSVSYTHLTLPTSDLV